MRTSLGISVGASGVGVALRADTAAGPTSEYRRVALDPDQHRRTGDLVFDAIEVMSTQVADGRTPDSVTVAYRTDEHAESVRRSAQRNGRLVRLVPETTALLAYLHTVGVRADAGTVAVVDVGASGTTVSVVEQSSGVVLRSARTDEVGGDAVGARIYEHVRRIADDMRTRMPVDPDLLASRCQGALEALTTGDSARIDIAEAGPDAHITLTRTDVAGLTADLADTAAAFTRRVCNGALPRPTTLALVGGTAAVPSIADAITAGFDGTVLEVPEPASAAAQGAALLGESPQLGNGRFGGHVVGSTRPGAGSASGRMSGAVAAVLVLGAILAGLAAEKFTDTTSDTAVAPVGTSGAVATGNDPAPTYPTATDIPTDDPQPVATTGSDDESLDGTPLPLPTTSVTTERPVSDPRTTVTPTPIDQVPTPDLSAPDTPHATIESTDPDTGSSTPGRPGSSPLPLPDLTNLPWPPTTTDPTDPTEPTDEPDPSETTDPSTDPSVEPGTTTPTPTPGTPGSGELAPSEPSAAPPPAQSSPAQTGESTTTAAGTASSTATGAASDTATGAASNTAPAAG